MTVTHLLQVQREVVPPVVGIPVGSLAVGSLAVGSLAVGRPQDLNTTVRHRLNRRRTEGIQQQPSCLQSECIPEVAWDSLVGISHRHERQTRQTRGSGVPCCGGYP
jgi:hypothetical protein